jgi:hypothetical protein
MSEMVERVARALFEAADGASESDLVYNSFPDSRATWDKFARAAIGAMREALCSPTEEMREAYHEAEEAPDHPTECHVNARRLRAMIDNALE